MMSSLIRSAMRTKPSSSIVTTSPVRNQPPSSSTAAVSSGRPWYPRNTWGPRTRSSPGSPAGRSIVGSSGSTTRTSVFGSGSPTVPAQRVSPTGLAINTGEHSERP